MTAGKDKRKATIDRIAIVVPDIEAAAKAFNEVFGFEYHILTIPELGIKAGVCNQGVELVEKLDMDKHLFSNYAGGVLASLAVRVPDLEAAAKKLEEQGAEKINEAVAGDFKELYYESKTFHGIPITLCEYQDDFVESIGSGSHEIPEDMQPTITWFKPEYDPHTG